jgi:hypothetical protein
MLIGKGTIRIAFIAMSMVLLAGCHEQPQSSTPASESNTKEPSDMRTVIPLVRRLAPDETGPIELEFEVPAWKDNPAPPLFIGVRLVNVDPASAYDGDSTAVSEAARRLQDAGVSAEVHLYRIQGTNQAEVSLRKSEWTSESGPPTVVDSAVPTDGVVKGLTPADADIQTLEAAGLLPADSTYRQFAKYHELEFAYASSVPNGRYRATIRFVKGGDALSKENPELIRSELIIAYPRQAK